MLGCCDCLVGELVLRNECLEVLLFGLEYSEVTGATGELVNGSTVFLVFLLFLPKPLIKRIYCH